MVASGGTGFVHMGPPQAQVTYGFGKGKPMTQNGEVFVLLFPFSALDTILLCSSHKCRSSDCFSHGGRKERREEKGSHGLLLYEIKSLNR